jgi:hypothetical protein
MVTRKAAVKETIITAGEARKYRRMDLAAEQYGVTVALFKKLINSGKLRRYKLGSVTFIDAAEFEALITPDVGNHGPEAAPEITRRGSR